MTEVLSAHQHIKLKRVRLQTILRMLKYVLDFK